MTPKILYTKPGEAEGQCDCDCACDQPALQYTLDGDLLAADDATRAVELLKMHEEARDSRQLALFWWWFEYDGLRVILDDNKQIHAICETVRVLRDLLADDWDEGETKLTEHERRAVRDVLTLLYAAAAPHDLLDAFKDWIDTRATSAKTVCNRIMEAQAAHPELGPSPQVQRQRDWRARAGVLR